MTRNIHSLRFKIYFGFAVIIVLLIAVGGIGYFGAQSLNSSSADMLRISAVNTTVLQVDRDVQALQLRVGRYVTSGNKSEGGRIVSLCDELTELITQTAADQTDEELRDLINRMAEFLAPYSTQFQSVVEERQLRAELVQTLLPELSNRVLTELRNHRKSLAGDQEAEVSRLMLLSAEAMFSQAEKRLLQYFVSPNSVHVNQALKAIDETEVALAAVSLSNGRSIESTLAALREFRSTSVRAVQATRSYLFLVNVVMAGEASEVAYYSNQLRQVSEERAASIAAQVAAVAVQVRRVTGIGIAVALVIGMLISARLAFLILKPITSLTETFQRLAAGETLLEIPETERTDEIGQMAIAARVFSDQNRKRQELLEETGRLAEELTEKASELEATNAELDSFAYVASHDLKSPLRGIRHLARWINEDSGHLLPEESVKHFEAIQSRIGRMETLLDDLLNYSRVGRLEAAPETVDVAELFGELVEIINNPHAVQVSWPPNLPVLYTIRAPLKQIFINLIGNAVKHNHRDGGGTVEIFCRTNSDFHEFVVRDNGPGIEPQHHDRVFKMYQRLATAEVEGSGMGLAIVRKQVERFGGTIRIESTPGNGASFIFSWPVSVAQKEAV